MDISVAIPVYNRAEYIEQTLDAILGQTQPVAEIVAVNDGSTDNTAEVLRRYQGKVKVITIENSGAGNARAVAAAATSCPWLAFCDSDDIWMPNHIERRLALLSAYPEATFTFSDALPFGPAAIAGKTYFSDTPKAWWDNFGQPDAQGFLALRPNFYRGLLESNPVLPTTILMTRELYDKTGGIDARYSRMPAEDADLTRKAGLYGVTVCDKEVTAKQRRHHGNMSRVAIENMVGRVRILEDHLALGIAPESEFPFVKEAIRQSLSDIVLTAFYQRDYAQLEPVAEKIKLADLPFSLQLRLIYLRFHSLLKK